jgi:hypothetical protein
MEDYSVRVKLKDLIPFVGLKNYVHRTYPVLRETLQGHSDLMERCRTASRRVKLLAAYNLGFLGGSLYCSIKGLEALF